MCRHLELKYFIEKAQNNLHWQKLYINTVYDSNNLIN